MYQDFINISEFTDYNPFITKHFLFFILFLNKNLNKGYKGNKGIKVIPLLLRIRFNLKYLIKI